MQKCLCNEIFKVCMNTVYDVTNCDVTVCDIILKPIITYAILHLTKCSIAFFIGIYFYNRHQKLAILNT